MAAVKVGDKAVVMVVVVVVVVGRGFMDHDAFRLSRTKKKKSISVTVLRSTIGNEMRLQHRVLLSFA